MWNKAQIELVFAWALWEAGLIRWAEAMLVLERADKIPVFRCQGSECFKFSPTCLECGERLPKGWVGPCADCEEVRAQLYEPTGRRRSFQILR